MIHLFSSLHSVLCHRVRAAVAVCQAPSRGTVSINHKPTLDWRHLAFFLRQVRRNSGCAACKRPRNPERAHMARFVEHTCPEERMALERSE
ncbi:hypothetical protein BV25DRAFT_1042429 [Artomyces pyxidatus]|uniref:Uncharacterized protein n=1 Tax=Artomyces pyxidatus TaxID=48021 RepID=A0ACB8SU37_9AGAM|nr:hypothetical protein BV25DRAFT_1042429 [Artomyces pyxidatus]